VNAACGSVPGSARLWHHVHPNMRYRVVLHPSDEGFAVSCPALPGCWSQGNTEEEALENIGIAIQEYLAAQADAGPGEVATADDAEVREIEVLV